MNKQNEAGHTMEIGPKFDNGGFDEFWFIPLKWKKNKGWAGGETVSRKKSTDVVRVKHIDLYSGWAASADDPKTLAPFEKAVEMLHNGQIEYIVYIPDGDDDPELVKLINARLCPIELEAKNGPTYSDLVNAENAMRPSDTEQVTVGTLIPLLADIAFGPWPDEIELVSNTSEELTAMLNAYRRDHGDSTTYTQEWVEEVLDAALADDGQHIVFALIGWSIRITQKTDENNAVSYWFEKITGIQPYPYS